MCVFVCAELPLAAMGPGQALGLQISLVPSSSPRRVPLGTLAITVVQDNAMFTAC